MEVLSEAINSVYYIYDADIQDLEKLHEVGAGEELAELVDVLLCKPPYNVSRQTKLEDTSHDVFRPNDMHDFCNLAKQLIKPGGHGHVFCSDLRIF